MTYNLETELKRRERATYAAAIKTAARMIADCPCERKRWEAMRELRRLQVKLGNPVL